MSEHQAGHRHESLNKGCCGCGGCRSKFAADPAKYVLQPAEALADVKTFLTRSSST